VMRAGASFGFVADDKILKSAKIDQLGKPDPCLSTMKRSRIFPGQASELPPRALTQNWIRRILCWRAVRATDMLAGK